MSERNLLTVPEFAGVLNVTQACVRRWLLERKITSVKVGARLVRIPSSEVQRIIDAGLRPGKEAK